VSIAIENEKRTMKYETKDRAQRRLNVSRYVRGLKCDFLPKSKIKDAPFFLILSGFYIFKMLDKADRRAIIVWVYFIKQISFYSTLFRNYEDR
jgi:hypothetical protein